MLYITNDNVTLKGINDINKSDVYNKNNVHLEQLNATICPNNNGTKIEFGFHIGNNIDGIMNKFVALYVKKLIKKVKLYFDM
jgi:hypothetical protein